MPQPTNPWVTAPLANRAQEGPTCPAPTAPPRRAASAPQAGVPMPDVADRLGLVEVPADVAGWVVGVHGGAGETTLSRLLPEVNATGHRWPSPAGGAAVPVVLAARTHMSGLLAAQHAATEWASGAVSSVSLVGLVLVADSPSRLSRPLREFIDVLAGGVPQLWRLPWVERWRSTVDPTDQAVPTAVARITEQVRAALTEGN